MSIEQNFNWIYTILILPIVLLYQKHYGLKNRVTVLETKAESTETLCNDVKTLSKEVHTMLGRLDEHIKSKSL